MERNGFFNDTSESIKEDLVQRLKNVIECRNWVVHSGFKELEGKKINDDMKIFQHIARNIQLFKANPNPFEPIKGKYLPTGGYKELENNIKSGWKNACRIDFNREERTIIDPTIGSASDWAAVKIIMTKYLMFEFLDILSKNPISILLKAKRRRE